ncbi:methyltransferase-like protein 7A [Canna indica]|uniref:Methyltransferase-like protein 7A n=1 Tax=Canna indica TaxID=4628 RepID=A0AAQ3JSC3_9LILI|nr:methyltransferase-like protein 7A [Canna indica]
MRSVCVNHLLATAPIHSPTATAKRSSAGRLTHPVTYPPCPASITRAPPPSSASAAAAEPPRRPLEVERETPPASFCHHCLRVSKRSLLLGASSAMLPVLPAASAFSGGPPSHPAATLERIHPPRPDWYEELFAKAMDQGMKSYEAEVSVYKKKLFSKLTDKCKKLVELGVGTAPNFRYYANAADRYVIGVDPNKQMEKYARASADAAGLQSKNFSFIQGVGEYLDLRDNTVDAVIGTLVLCSVNDVAMTLRGTLTFSSHLFLKFDWI